MTKEKRGFVSDSEQNTDSTKVKVPLHGKLVKRTV